MKRFVDLREAGIGAQFAFWDTVTDKFEQHSGAMTWDSFREFEHDYCGGDLARYRAICPEWAFDVALDGAD